MGIRVIGKQQVEVDIQESFCDGCLRAFRDFDSSKMELKDMIECDGVVDFSFGYHSKHDTGRARLLLCQDCSEVVWQFIKQKFPHNELNYDNELLD